MADPWATGPYANETYLRSLAGSSADVQRQVANAYNEIQRQRVAYQAAAGQVAGAAGTAFNESQSRLGTSLASLGMGIQSQAVQNAYSGGRESYGKVAGLLQQGFGEQETRRRGQVTGIQNDLMADLRQKGHEYVSRRTQEDRERQHQEQMAAAQRALQIQLANQQIAAQRQIAAMQAAEADKIRREQEQQDYWEGIAAAVAMGMGPQPLTGYEKAKAQYLAMKDRQNL